MKRAFLIAFAFGLGIATAALAAMAYLSWRSSRPVPWDTTSITATFDSIDTEGPENKLVFSYVLQNNTDQDFRIASAGEVELAGKLRRQKSLTQGSPDNFMSIDAPLFLPSRQRTRLVLHLGYAYEGKESLLGQSTKESREHDRDLIAAYVRDELTNLEGFVVFHEGTRRQIDLPMGWK